MAWCGWETVKEGHRCWGRQSNTSIRSSNNWSGALINKACESLRSRTLLYTNWNCGSRLQYPQSLVFTITTVFQTGAGVITYSLNWNSVEIYYVSLIPKFKLLTKLSKKRNACSWPAAPQAQTGRFTGGKELIQGRFFECHPSFSNCCLLMCDFMFLMVIHLFIPVLSTNKALSDGLVRQCGE